MIQTVWAGENRRLTVCIDSYENSVMKGRILNANQEIEPFESLVQFLLGVETFLEAPQMPQSYTSLRRFADLIPMTEGTSVSNYVGKGAKATFELQVLFRQHSSWQGVVIWRERKMEQSFRSVLELVMLMDSALRTVNEGVA